MDRQRWPPGRLVGIPARLRETSRVHWQALSRVGRVSVAGVAASAVLAVALGLFIPRVAEHHAIEARLDAVRSLVRILEDEGLIPPVGDHLTGPAYRAFDAVVRGGLLGGLNLRVKLWNPAGEIVYSDEPRLVGRRFPVGGGLAAAFAGRATAEPTDLTKAENRYERALAGQLLEIYVPVRRDGEVVGAFEVYQDLGHLTTHLAAVRTAVWTAVGSGLSVLLVFLVSLFAATARTMAREHQAASDRAEDLALLLATSRTLAGQPTLERAGPEAVRALVSRLDLRCAALVLQGESRFVTADEGSAAVCPLGLAAARQACRREQEVTLTGRGEGALGHGDPDSSCSVVAVPFRSGAEVPGALVACRDAARALSPRERTLLAGVAGQLGVAAEVERLFRDLRDLGQTRARLLRRLVDAQEDERRRLVGDLHDGLGQTLTRILYGLRGSRARLRPDQAEVAAELERLESLTDEQARHLRRYMAAIRPAVLEDFGLVRALQAFGRDQEAESGIEIDVHAAPLPEPDPAVGVALFRAAQEAVMNVRKHAGARHVRIRVEARDGAVVLQVEDDGRGAADIQEGIGLTSMRDRVASLGGRVDIWSRPGAGTRVTVQVPLTVGRGDGADPGR